MKLEGKVVVVTGGGNGIGAAMARRFAAERAEAVVVVDLEQAAAAQVADEIGGLAIAANVGVEADVKRAVEETEKRFGRIDLFCSNAGILVMGGVEAANEDWQRIWDVNVMAHVYASRAVLPGMIARGSGYLLNTASAAGLLSQIGSAPYAVTKHAAVSLAEWLAISHGDQGIKVSVLCPQAVRTKMILGSDEGGVAGVDGVIEPSEVAQCVVEGIEAERFLILPHPKVEDYLRRKMANYDRWLGGMQRLQRRFIGGMTRA